MKVVLTPEVEEYLHHKHKEVMEVFVERIYSTHMMESIAHLEVKYGAPRKELIENFTLYEVDGFKIYLQNELINEENDVIFHLEKFLGFKYIEVDGLKRH